MKLKGYTLLICLILLFVIQAAAQSRSLSLGNIITQASSLYSLGWIPSPANSNNVITRPTYHAVSPVASASSILNSSISVDSSVPTVVLTSPGAGAVFSQEDVIIIKADAYDNDSDGSISKVEFFVNGTKAGEDTSSPYEFAWANTGAGDYTIKARAIDNMNWTKETNPITISILNGSGKIYRILPSGNSITYDNYIGDTRPTGERTGYRYKLWEFLRQDGYRTDFVGNRYAGENYFPDANNAGFPGITKGQLARMMISGINPANRPETPGPYLESYPADIILLHIGTNQVNESTIEVENILDEIDRYETSQNAFITVILAQIINRYPYNAVTTNYNKKLKAMAEARIANGDKILIVNMEEDAGLIYALTPDGGDMTDEYHPNASGYEKMAKVWYGAIKEVINGLNNHVPLPSAPALVSQANNTTGVALSPTLRWNAAVGATSYSVQVSTNPQFSSVIYEQNSLTETSVPVIGLLNNTHYYWRVNAANVTGTGAWSPIWNFTTAPLPPEAQLTTVTIASNNTNTIRAKTSDVVTVSFTANQPIPVPQVTIAGQIAAVSPVGTLSSAFTATYTLQENDPEGLVSFSINFRNAQGNTATPVTTTTNSSRVTFDRTAPVLSTVQIASNNANATKAKVGDVVTIALTANEPIYSPDVTIAGQTVTVSGVGASTTAFMATYTMTGNDPEGEIPISISFKDVTGNAGQVVNATTNNSKVIFDQTAPRAVISSTVSDLTNLNLIPLVITFSETVRGLEISDFTASNGAISNIQTQDNKIYTADFTPTAEGALAVTLISGKVTDNVANNNSSSNTWNSTYDRTQPTVVLSTAAALLTNIPFTVTFTFSEPVSGFGAEAIAVNTGLVSDFRIVSASSYTAVITPTVQGEVTVAVRANKAADRATNGNTASNELKLMYDSMAPAGYAVTFRAEKIDFDNQMNTAINITGAEIGTSYSYTITSAAGGTPAKGTGTAANAGFEIPALDVSNLADGTLTITFYQEDAAGNKGAAVTAQVEKLTLRVAAITNPAKLIVPFNTIFTLLPLPATVEVTYSDNTMQSIPVTWSAGNYNGAVAGTYELTGTLNLAPGTTNQQNLTARVLVEVELNKVPTALTLSTTTFSPAILSTEVIGTFTTTDVDDNQHTYTLEQGQGSKDNYLFRIQGNALYLLSNAGLSGKTQFSIRVRTTDPYRNTLEQVFSLSKGNYAKAVADLKIVNAFTPDGDGINDEWIIPELKFYNQVEIDVFDRSGVRLFHTTNPEKGWDGKDLKGHILKGPFLYLVQVKDINLVKKGVVTILKK